MADLQLERTPVDRRLFALEDVGTLHLARWGSRGATAEAAGRRWELGRRRFWQRAVQATDEAGVTVGEFEPRALGRGGSLTWGGRELALRPSSHWRERYALADGNRELAVLKGKSWGRRPVKITVDDHEALEPGLLLFATFVVRGLARSAGDDGSSAVITSGG